MKKENGLKKPFFSKFLENQLSESEEQTVQGGTLVVTKKYPSDAEDDSTTKPVADMVQTQKYPSDNEDSYTKPAADLLQTQKYPSDGDEEGPSI
jgi:hypothetical protein